MIVFELSLLSHAHNIHTPTLPTSTFLTITYLLNLQKYDSVFHSFHKYNWTTGPVLVSVSGPNLVSPTRVLLEGLCKFNPLQSR